MLVRFWRYHQRAATARSGCRITMACGPTGLRGWGGRAEQIPECFGHWNRELKPDHYFLGQFIIEWNKKFWGVGPWSRSLRRHITKSHVCPFPRVDFILSLKLEGCRSSGSHSRSNSIGGGVGVGGSFSPWPHFLKWENFSQNHVPAYTDFSRPIRMPLSGARF